MLGVFNGFYKCEEIIVDVVQLNPLAYGLEGSCIWFEVSITINGNDIALSDFHFYLADSNKKIINPSLMYDSSNYVKTKNDIGVFVGFEFSPDFFYNIPVFCFYCDTYKRVELIELVC